MCETALAALGQDWDSFALAMEHEDSWTMTALPRQCLGEVAGGVQKATTVGNTHLDLGIGYYSSDNGTDTTTWNKAATSPWTT